MNKCKKISICRCCKNIQFEKILDFGTQPLANNFVNSSLDVEKYPLDLYCCRHCYHLQLGHVVDKTILFDEYIYTSGTSKTMKNFFKTNALEIDELGTTKTVLDIACNDGSQLDAFFDLGWETVGVDPAKNIIKNVSHTHKIINGYWDSNMAKKLDTYFGVILSQNVFAHVDDLDEFINACKIVMNKDTKWFIQTSQATMVENFECDTIYHEHLSFFNCSSMIKVIERNGLFVNNVKIVPIHGNSYIFEVSKSKNVSTQLQEQYDLELKKGYYDIDCIRNYGKQCIKNINAKKLLLEKLSKQYEIIGYGACAKVNTLFNAMDITPNIIKYIIDDSKLKQGKYTPGTNIKIIDIDQLNSRKNYIILVLAWNFYDEIVTKVKKYDYFKILNIKDLKEQNIYVTSLHRIQNINNLYPIYKEVHEISLRSVKHFLQGNYDVIVLDKSFRDISEVFYYHFKKLYKLWYQKFPCNIFYCGTDCVFTNKTRIFGEYDDFRIFNYTMNNFENATLQMINFVDDMVNKYKITNPHVINIENGKHMKHYFNCDIRYFPSTMNRDIYDMGYAIMNDWITKYNYFSHGDQITYNLMLWNQGLNQDVCDGRYYQIVSNNNAINDKFNNCKVNDALIVHLHLSLFSSLQKKKIVDEYKTRLNFIMD